MKSVGAIDGKPVEKNASTCVVGVEKHALFQMKRSSLWATIDPGISGTGLALLDGKKLIKYVNIYPEKDWSTWEQRASSILVGLMWHITQDLTQVFIEWPSQFSGTKGLAASNSNDILKLSCLIGRISELFIQRNTRVILVPVQTWKGNLPKAIVAQRAMKFFGLQELVSHAADAVGLAKFVLEEKRHGG